MNFLKKKVKKAFESFTADDGDDNLGERGDSSSSGGAEVMKLLQATPSKRYCLLNVIFDVELMRYILSI